MLLNEGRSRGSYLANFGCVENNEPGVAFGWVVLGQAGGGQEEGEEEEGGGGHPDHDPMFAGSVFSLVP